MICLTYTPPPNTTQGIKPFCRGYDYTIPSSGPGTDMPIRCVSIESPIYKIKTKSILINISENDGKISQNEAKK